MRVRLPLLIVPVVIATLAAFGGVATAGKPGGGGNGGGVGGPAAKCESAPAGGGKIDKKQVKVIGECLDVLQTEFETQQLIVNGAANGCPSASASFNDMFGESLIEQAKSGLGQNKKISKSQIGYLKKAAGDKANKAQEDEIEAAAQVVGKALFSGDGVWSGTSGVGSALRNKDCDEAASKAGEAARQLKNYKAAVKDAKAALGKIK